MRPLSDRTPPLPLASLLLLPLLLVACDREAVAPTTPPTPPPAANGREVLGVVAVTIAGIGSGAMHTSASTVGAEAPGTGADGLSLDLTPVPGSDGSIQLEPVSTGGFTEGSRGSHGERYIYATFKVRNATSGGTAHSTPRTNLTFLAVSTASTIEGTAIAAMDRFDGSRADPSIARQLLPTGAVHQVSGQRTSTEPDVLQVLAEAEAASFATPSSVTSVFPYGFVVHNPNAQNSRTLPASPAAGQFDGIVTFAFRVPLQADPADDPFTVTALFLAVDDGTTRLTQSLEEQGPTGEAAFAARAQALGASEVTLLPGGNYAGTASSRMVCSVRTAGPASAPAATLVDATGASFQSLTPDPYAADGSGSFIRNPTSFSATFGSAVDEPTAQSFVVNGSQSGRHFLGDSYSGAGTNAVTSPSGTFFPGEEVEVSLTTALAACGDPVVARFRVAAPTPSTGTFTVLAPSGVDGSPNGLTASDLDGDGKLDLVVPDLHDGIVKVLFAGGPMANGWKSWSAGGFPGPVATGDLNGDGLLDLVTANYNRQGTISVLLGTDDQTFGPHTEFATGPSPFGVAIGDLNGDGTLDVAATNNVSVDAGAVSVLLGHGDGTFGPHTDYPTPGIPTYVAMGDLNGDGALDLVTNGEHSISVLLGNGDGTFRTHTDYAAPAAAEPGPLVVGDLNDDGKLDVATANFIHSETAGISVLLGNGDGAFQTRRDYATGAGAEGAADIAIGDLNGDGHLDLATSEFDASSISVLLGDGSGGFPTSVQYSVDDLTPRDLAIGDLNGDGKLDLAALSPLYVSVVVLRNQ